MPLPVEECAHFGSGGDAPYDTAVRRGGGVLRIIGHGAGQESHVDLARFLAPADDADRSVLERAEDAVLDVGCGPGRMVRAAIVAGHLTLGLDVSDAAVEHAHAQGLPVLRRSVFDAVPREGEWGSILLLDGNIGIGGDPTALLLRCARLVRPGGSVLVEAHPDPVRDRGYSATLIDGEGGASLPFPWHEVGARALRRRADAAGLVVADAWTSADRSFLALRRGDAAIGAGADAVRPAESAASRSPRD